MRVKARSKIMDRGRGESNYIRIEFMYYVSYNGVFVKERKYG